MIRVLKLFHFLGLVIFLGSILTFIIVSALIEGASLENIAFGRKIISTGTYALTLPGLWIIAVTGIWMGIKRYGLKQRFFQIKFIIAVLIIINAYFFVVPGVSYATELALRSLIQGHLFPEYRSAYLRESLFGAVNVLLAVIAAIVGVWKIGLKNE